MTSLDTGRRYDLSFYCPHDYHYQLEEQGEFNYCWDRGFLINKRWDPVQWAKLNILTPGAEVRQYVVGTGYTQEYDNNCKNQNDPKAVYPTWGIRTDSWNELFDYIENPWGQNIEYCTDLTVARYARPVLGQPHRIFIVGMDSGSRIGQNHLIELSNIQKDHPEVEFVIHKTYSFQVMFGLNFRACTTSPRFKSGQRVVFLPNGRRVNPEKRIEFAKDIRALGWQPSDLDDAGECCSFNINSLRQASVYWAEHTRLRHTTPQGWKPNVEAKSLQPSDFPLKGSEPAFHTKDRKPGDMLVCNTCSFWRRCSRYQEGSVCMVSGSEGKNLADHFGSGNADLIVQGLGSILSKRAERVETAMNKEQFTDKLDPEIDKMLSSIFKDGATLAKMLDPKYARPTVQINNSGGKTEITAAVDDARGLASQVIADLERLGYKREEITEEVIDSYLQSHMSQNKEILPAEVVEE